MANLLYSSTVGLLSGSVGNETYSRNRSGAIVKAKKTTGYPPSPYSTVINTNFSTISQAWSSGLTQMERDSWINAAPNFKKNNRLTEKFTPSGFNLFMSINLRLLAIGEAMITVPPNKIIFPQISINSFVGSQTPQILRLNVSPSGFIANYRYEYWLTSQLSVGISSWWKYRRLLLVSNDTIPSPIALRPAYVARFGPLVTGSKIYVGVIPIDILTGLKGSMITSMCVIT